MKITIIGGGPGGYEAALYAAEKGAKVTLVEKNELGGTCLQRGCIPTKSLLAASEAFAETKKAKDFGIQIEQATFDYLAIVERKDKIVAQLTQGIAKAFEKAGIRHLRGTGSVIDASTVRVAFAEGGEEIVTGDRVLIATGSQPTRLPFLEIDGENIITSDDFLAAKALPKSLMILGGGVIGCEIAQFAANLGCAVTIVEAMAHILPLEDADTAQALERQFRRERVKTICGNSMTAVEHTESGIRATLQDGKWLEAEKLLVAVGRRPFTEGLDFSTDEKGFIPVDAHMETSTKGIYAVGDVVKSPQLAHIASYEGRIAIDNMLGATKEANYRAVPRCVYTYPQIASVGLTEAEMPEDSRKGSYSFIGNGKARAAGKTEGFVKILASAEGRILGAAIVGDHATEMLQMFTLAVQKGLTVEDMLDCIYPHPTLSEGIFSALQALQKA